MKAHTEEAREASGSYDPENHSNCSLQTLNIIIIDLIKFLCLLLIFYCILKTSKDFNFAFTQGESAVLQ